MKLKEWFDRTEGHWLSERRYIFNSRPSMMTSRIYTGPLEEERVSLIPDTFNADLFLKFKWTTTHYDTLKEVSGGEMLVGVNTTDHTIYRSVGYMTDKPTVTNVTMVDDDTVVLITEYDNQQFREEIRLLHNDTVRLRQTVGFSGDRVTVVGQYYETRTDDYDVQQVSNPILQ
jgi:hypothetical protein